MATYTPRTDFAQALSQIANERGVDVSIIVDSIKAAIVAAYRKDASLTGEFKEDWHYEADIDAVTGETKVYGFVRPETPEGEEPTEEQLVVARKDRKDVTPPGFGRIAAQTAKQVILQKIREAEKNAIISEYEKRLGTLINGMVLRFVGSDIIIDLGKGEAVMPPYEQVPSENYRLNQRLTFYIEGIRDGVKGREIVVSRAHKGLVESLFKREVPEVGSGVVQIKAIAREPGVRTKIAVASTQSGVDPVGSCVGQKGVRVQAVIEELNNEKIDIIQYSEDADKFIIGSLAPAANLSVSINSDKKSAQVTVPADQLSLAIGRDGQNVRLASKLTGYKIDIEGQDLPAEPVTAPAEQGTSEAVAETPADASTSQPAPVADDTTASPVSDDQTSEPVASASSNDTTGGVSPTDDPTQASASPSVAATHTEPVSNETIEPSPTSDSTPESSSKPSQ